MDQDRDRITPMLERIRAEIKAKGLDAKALAKLSKGMDVDLMDYVSYQELKSEAFAAGKISLAEANMVYGWLGNTPDQFNRQELAVKIVVTKLIDEILGQKLKGVRRSA